MKGEESLRGLDCWNDASLGTGIEGAKFKKIHGDTLLQQIKYGFLEQHLGSYQSSLVKKT